MDPDFPGLVVTLLSVKMHPQVSPKPCLPTMVLCIVWGYSFKMTPRLFQYSAHSPTNTMLSAGTPIASPKAVHTGGSNGPIIYSILSGNEKGTFSIQPNTGKGQ